MSELLDKLLAEAERGEALTDPRCGKHEAALLTAVAVVTTETSMRLELSWSGMTDSEGQPFQYTQRLFIPDAGAHAVTKIRFMSTLKALGIIPHNRKEMVYFAEDQLDALRDAIMEECGGQEFPLTISLDNRGFYNTTIRERPQTR